MWSSTWYGLFAFSRWIARSKSDNASDGSPAFQVQPGSQSIEVGQPGLELDRSIQLVEGQVQLVEPAVRLRQVDIRLIGVGLQLDRGIQVGDRIVEPAGPDPQDPAIDEEHIAGIVVEGHLRGLQEVGLRRTPRLKLLMGEAPQEIEPEEIGSLRQTGARGTPGPRRAAAAARDRAR